MSEEGQRKLQETVSQTNVREWQQALINQVLKVLFLVALPALVFAVYYVWKDGRGWLIPFYVGGFALLTLLRFWRGAPYALQVGVLLAIVYALALLSLSRAGLASNAPLFLVALSFVATIFLDKRAATASVIVSIVTMIVAAWVFVSGKLSIAPEAQIITSDVTAWVSYTLTLLMAIVFFVASQNYLLPRLTKALDQSRNLTHELEAGRRRAEDDAERRRQQAERLGWVAELGNVLASLRRRDDLVWRVVREIAGAFGVYQVNLFLMDRAGNALTLAAADGAQGEALVKERYQIPVGARLLPGQVAQIGREQMALLSPDELPLFPLSRVEVSFPLSVRGEVLGVLDIHSAALAFSEEVLQLFRIVTGYVTTSLDVVQLFEESEAQIREMRALYAQSTLTSWRELLEAGEAQSFMVGTTPETAVVALAADAVAARAPRSTWLDEAQAYLLIVPLVARDVALGYLAFTRSVEKGDWDADSRALVGAAAERLAIALDNTRLLVEMRQQALYDEQLSRLGTMIWETPVSDVIMEQSVRVLGRFLGASEVQLVLAPGDAATPRGGENPPAGKASGARSRV